MEQHFQQGSLFSALDTDTKEPVPNRENFTEDKRATQQSPAELQHSSTSSNPAKSTVTIQFLPNGVSVEATPGESLLQVAHDAGVDIPTGCLRGSCHACEVETNVWGAVCSCIAAVPEQEMVPEGVMVVELWADPTW